MPKNQNQSIADIAMKTAENFEHKRTGKLPDSSPSKKRAGYDLLSEDRKIEVKGTQLLWKEYQSSYHIVTENERKNATHLYMVCNVLKTPDLHIFEMSKLHKALTPDLNYRLQFSRCKNDESKETAEGKST
jgi:hypothetical protein